MSKQDSTNKINGTGWDIEFICCGEDMPRTTEGIYYIYTCAACGHRYRELIADA